MTAAAAIFGLALLAAGAPAAAPPAGEPLPAGAPSQPYDLTAWCYGAMSEYLGIYDRVKPDLRAIDKMFGSSQPNEAAPYSADMNAARIELKVLASAVQSAEKASVTPIAPEGAEAIKLGRSIWLSAESKSNRELARAWLSWAMPDRCDSTARSLAANSALFGQALKYNTGATGEPAPSPAPAPAPAPVYSAPPTVLAHPTAARPAPVAPAPVVAPAPEPVREAPKIAAAPKPPPVLSAPPAPPAPAPADNVGELDPNGPVPDSPHP
ncbi:MAG: hypothetical protein ABI056_05865 [Caulobacteraceae bacterium]